MARAVVYSAAAQTAGMDYAPDVLRLPIGALAFRQTTHALSKVLYDAVVEKVHSEVEALALLGMPVALFIPPLTAKILSESASAQDFPSQILALRDRFAGFRDTYNKFLLLLKDPSITMKDKIAAKERLFKDITGVIERGEADHALNIRTLWDKLVSSELDRSGPSAKLSLSGLVSLVVEQAMKEHTKGRARAIFDLWVDTLNLKNYGVLIENTFHTKIRNEDVERFQRYSRAVKAIIRN
jgi:hypothetical protein